MKFHRQQINLPQKEKEYRNYTVESFFGLWVLSRVFSFLKDKKTPGKRKVESSEGGPSAKKPGKTVKAEDKLKGNFLLTPSPSV